MVIQWLWLVYTNYKGVVCINIDEVIDKHINERWHKIDGYDCYVVTESGKIYAYRNSSSLTGWQGLRKLVLRGKNNSKRYLQACLCKNNIRKYVQVHRLVGKYFVDGYFDGAVINHKDGDIHNNLYTNLEWVTQRENVNKSYITSGVDQIRNYKEYKLILPDGTEINKIFKGMNFLIKYAEENGYNVSTSSLVKFKRSRGFVVKELEKYN